MVIEVDTQELKYRRTRIVATLGPASSTPEMISKLIDSGVNVFRLNMSHGDHGTHRATYESIRRIAEEKSSMTTILADLSGPKIRTGRFEGGSIELEEGSDVIVTTREVIGREGLIPSQYENLADDVSAGDRILLDDGNLELAVTGVDGTEISAKVIHGGKLSDRKGMNLPGVDVSAPSLTAKDRIDAEFAVELGVDALALSFVRRASDVLELRDLVEKQGAVPYVIAKIEKPEALDQIDEILEAADGIMVARGDLGVELPPEAVPIVQSRLVELARASGKPVIVATQMLESMITNARPTRAEVSDVSTAVISGADGVMLSGETASGAHPVEAVQTMDRVARKTEAFLWRSRAFGGFRPQFETSASAAIGVAEVNLGEAFGVATAQLSRDLRVRAIVVETSHGVSAARVSAGRPAAPILAIAPDKRICRRLNMLWGVIPFYVEPEQMGMVDRIARDAVLDKELGSEGEFILKVAGFHKLPEKNQPSVTVLSL